MNYTETPPHVCFKARFSPPKKAARELRRLLKAGIRSRIGLLHRRWTWFLPYWTSVLEFKGSSFSVALRSSKHYQDEWILLVTSNDVPFRWMRGRETPEYVPQLKFVCQQIHALLAATPEISEVRWYFQGPGDPTIPVLTPDELAWDADN